MNPLIGAISKWNYVLKLKFWCKTSLLKKIRPLTYIVKLSVEGLKQIQKVLQKIKIN